MKRIVYLALMLTVGCSHDYDEQVINEKPEPLKSRLRIDWVACNTSELMLIDKNNTVADTVLRTSERALDLELLDRGYYELVIDNNGNCETEVIITKNDSIIKNYSGIVSGVTIQFFNR